MPVHVVTEYNISVSGSELSLGVGYWVVGLSLWMYYDTCSAHGSAGTSCLKNSYYEQSKAVDFEGLDYYTVNMKDIFSFKDQQRGHLC